ncbi:MAG TPA: DnaB-like helicase N-terminal domain-containing protein, partial [Spongiibacteraceae bacterium]
METEIADEPYAATLPPDLDIAQLKLPPHSLEAEQSVLGGLMIANDAWDKVADMVTDVDFYRPEHRLIFRRMAQ